MPSATRFNVRIQDMDDYADEQTWEGRHTFNDPVDIYSNLDVKGSIDIYSSTGLYILGLFSSADKAVISSVDDGGGSPIGHDLLVEARYMRFWVENESGTLGREVARFEHAGLMFLGDNAYISIDEIRARDGDGLKLYDDGGNGIFVKDGGYAGFGTADPQELLHISAADNAAIRIESTDISLTTDQVIGGIDWYTNDDSVGGTGLSGRIRNLAEDTFGIVTALVFETRDDGGSLLSEKVRITSDGRVGIDITIPTAKLHVDQLSTTAAIPVLYLDQADVSEELIEFNTTIGVGNAIEAKGTKSLTTTHFLKVTLPGSLTCYIPCGTIA